MTKAQFICLHVNHAQNSTPEKAKISLWNNYKSNDRKFKRVERCMQEHLYEHFYSNGFLEDVAITLIDKTDRRDPKNRENYWMRTLKTLAPDGLNIEDCV